jgi:hypothetical protein
MKSSFEAKYPSITRWVKESGTVEIGYDSVTDSFIRAMDEGGMPWSGMTGIMSSGAAWTPCSISTKDETHAHFQRVVPPGNGRLSELPPHRSLEGKGNRHFVAGQSGGSASLVSQGSVTRFFPLG